MFRRRVAQFLRWTTLGLVFATVLLAVVNGERVSTYQDLQSALLRGGVTEVRAEGPLEATHADLAKSQVSGTATVRLTWTEDGVNRAATVHQVVPASGEDPPTNVDGFGRDGVSGTIVGPVSSELARYAPGVHVTTVPEPMGWTWRAPHVAWLELRGGWAVLLPLTWVTFVAGLVLGPEPRGATRWAWFWIGGVPWVLVVAPVYVLWGCRGHDPARRRLTGGWAFVLSLLLLP